MIINAEWEDYTALGCSLCQAICQVLGIQKSTRWAQVPPTGRVLLCKTFAKHQTKKHKTTWVATVTKAMEEKGLRNERDVPSTRGMNLYPLATGWVLFPRESNHTTYEMAAGMHGEAMGREHLPSWDSNCGLPTNNLRLCSRKYSSSSSLCKLCPCYSLIYPCMHLRI